MSREDGILRNGDQVELLYENDPNFKQMAEALEEAGYEDRGDTIVHPPNKETMVSRRARKFIKWN